MAKTNDAWWTPGHMAASSGRYECLKLLIELNIDINAGAGPRHTSTLLHEASYYGNNEIVRLLLENGRLLNFVKSTLREEIFARRKFCGFLFA